MKKIFILGGAVLGVALLIFTLLISKGALEEKAKANELSSQPVSVVSVTKGQLAEEVSQVGTIVANNDVSVVSEIGGKVTAVMVEEGTHVQPGSPLLKIEDVVPEANYVAAQTNYEKAQKDYQSYQTLYNKGLISESELDLARLTLKSAQAQYIGAGRQYHNSVVTSPITGVVTARPVNVGVMVNPGTVVANIIDNSLFKVKLNIAEKDVFKMRTGDAVEVTTDVYPGAKLNGRVKSISDKATPSHTYPVEVVIHNSEQYPLKSGMFGTVTFKLSQKDTLVIPRKAVIGNIPNVQVFVVQNGVATLRNISTGAESSKGIEVTGGLTEGETVVVSGENNLRDHTQVIVKK
jgi:RND family efflux transporter MFP subunit